MPPGVGVVDWLFTTWETNHKSKRSNL